MASDFARVSSGDRLRVPAAAWNEFLRLLDRPHDIRSGAAAASRETVLVRNDCGVARAQFEILGLDVPVVLPANNEVEFKARVIFSGVAPVAVTHGSKFAVLQEPLAIGAIGEAVITGVTVHQVTASGTTKEFARVASAAYRLEHADDGAARILWAEASGTDRWAVLDVGGGNTITGAAWVQISSLTQTSGRYPGHRYSYDAGGQTWTQKEVVWVELLNGAIAATGVKYQGRYVGAVSGQPVYETYSGKTEVVEVTGAAVAGVYPGVLKKYNAGTWSDAEAIDIVEINGANLSGWSGGIYDWGED